MNTLLKSALITATAALSLGLAGCDNQATKQVKAQAKAVDASYEAQADAVEAAAMGSPNEAAAEQKADALRDKGENIKDNLIDEAKEVQHDSR